MTPMEAAITPEDEAADQRVADESAFERRRPGTVRRHRPTTRGRNADRRHAGHALQRATHRSTESTTCCTRPPSTWRGHNDLLAGVIIGADGQAASRFAICAASWERSTRLTTSICLQRGLKTFELRMQRHNENGQAVAEFLAAHPANRKGLLPRPRITSLLRSRPDGRCAATAAW